MNLAVVNEAVTEMNGVEHQFTEEENVYIDSLGYEQFMMLGDAELSRRFSMQDEAEQKVPTLLVEVLVLSL